QKDFRIGYRWTPISRVSANLPIALVAAEDQKFPNHHGFDVDAIQDALADADDGARLRGASTISQQVAKNLYLTTHRSVLRKAAEAWFTVLIETLWSKQRILEMHLNIAEWGPGTFGACAAASQYFHRSPAELDERQAALLAATLPAPLERSPAAPGAYTQQRAGWILEQMPRVDLP
ncbi:MAG: monofunctional biosynthetic peptidoglycan transglycosylase, partial [Xanthomonadales bacterium]|nr:monofunctional biosynthetic peptidoglycan transglycosylase [Xanthomonadales bacterium]